MRIFSSEVLCTLDFLFNQVGLLMTGESLWCVADVASFLSMSRQWVYKHAELGTLPCLRLGAALRFKPEAVRRYIADLERRRTYAPSNT